MQKSELISLAQKYANKYPSDIHAEKTLDFLNSYDKFWQRENEFGHITASCWVLNQKKNKALLTHHKKLNNWFQLGGHIEAEDANIFEASQREFLEESGLQTCEINTNSIFDLDVHLIPKSKKGVPAHYHFDVRILIIANEKESIAFDTSESKDVKWIPLEEVHTYNSADSVMRMVRKSFIKNEGIT